MAFKMKGSPMKRNFGIGNSKTSPNKHGDLDTKLKDNIGNQHTGKKGHSHPHKGRLEVIQELGIAQINLYLMKNLKEEKK